MVLRLLDYWRTVRDERAWPDASHFDERSVPEIWPFCYVLDISSDQRNPRILRAGRSISSYVGITLAGGHLTDLPTNSLPAQPCAYIPEVMKKRVPVSRGGSFQDARGVMFLYRSIVLPAGEDDRDITALVCAANCREVVAG